jgi:hypothetical protein
MAAQRMQISFKQTFDILYPYAKSRVVDQVKGMALIIVYLVLFQTVVLGIGISQALTIALGLGLVIFGLAFFLEGLLLGLMPLGEQCGVRLPQKLKLPLLLVFAFILGFGATLAEPAVGILKAAGFSVKAWDAPLLFLILNKYSIYLIVAVGIGVGIAVIFGMLRFIYRWSLKPFIYVLVSILLAISVVAFFDPNWAYLTGIAWDCGGVTTGPVTVPLVLALGIGVTRILGTKDSGVSGGFGVVTLASAFPVLTVMLLGLFLLGSVPAPTSDARFFSADNRAKVTALFRSADEMRGYAFKNASSQAQAALFDDDEAAMNAFLALAATNPAERVKVFGSDAEFYTWVLERATDPQRGIVLAGNPSLRAELDRHQSSPANRLDIGQAFFGGLRSAAQAILPLSIFLLLVFIVILRERLPRADEVFLGVFLALIGMTAFNIGIELGLAKLGNQVGAKLPSSFQAIELQDQKTVIRNFEPTYIQSAIGLDGSRQEFFYARSGVEYKALPFDEKSYNQELKQYVYTPERGPLFGPTRGFWGILVLLVFGLLLGYGATLAEPALNALGLTVEELSVGTFKKSLLIQAVAIGVGVGIAWGVAKIVWDLPLIWLLVPPYLVCGVLTVFSSEDYVNIGWDSAGVTTGPITVPLVLAMGLGVSGQVGVTEGFGILALASVYPILSVLVVGIMVTRKRKAALRDAGQEG